MSPENASVTGPGPVGIGRGVVAARWVDGGAAVVVGPVNTGRCPVEHAAAATTHAAAITARARTARQPPTPAMSRTRHLADTQQELATLAPFLFPAWAGMDRQPPAGCRAETAAAAAQS
jgi:hypothetical protein